MTLNPSRLNTHASHIFRYSNLQFESLSSIALSRVRTRSKKATIEDERDTSSNTDFLTEQAERTVYAGKKE